MAPIIPFVTEKIYCNLISPIQNLASVHLCDYPQIADEDIDENILSEIDTVIQIVSLRRSARNKANIKIRQPLAELSIYGNNLVKKVAMNNKEEILEELNIKNLSFVDSQSKLVSYILKPNFQLLGQKYGKDIKEISSKILKIKDQDIINKIKQGLCLEIELSSETIKILSNELIVEEIPVEGYGISTSNDIVVGIFTEISEDLLEEGLIRDLIRQVQNLRKDSDFKIEERISIQIKGTDLLNSALNNHKEYFMNEVLGVSLDSVNSINLKFSNTVKIAGEMIEFGISPVI